MNPTNILRDIDLPTEYRSWLQFMLDAQQKGGTGIDWSDNEQEVIYEETMNKDFTRRVISRLKVREAHDF